MFACIVDCCFCLVENAKRGLASYLSSMSLSNHVAIISGVSKGIGNEMAKQLLAKGCIVLGLGRNQPNITNSKFHFEKADIRNHLEVENACNALFKKVDFQVDFLVNNSGLGIFSSLENYTIEQWHEMFDVNVHGMFYLSKMVLPLMKKQERGHIINISSIAGLEGYAQSSGYNATKFAVRGLSNALYKEVRDFGIKVTCVYPGSVKTNFFDEVESIQAHDNMLMPSELVQSIIQLMETNFNFHPVNFEVRPLQPRGKIKKNKESE